MTTDFNLDIENKVPPARGKVLVSEPFLDDSYFSRSVVLLCEHNTEGTFGFVLNNYVEVSMQDILPDFPEIITRISVGGPVKTGNLYYVHTHGEIEGCDEVLPGLYMGGDFKTLKILIASGMVPASNVRFFVGYSGWESNQLQEEINRKSWLVSELGAADVMNTQLDHLWQLMMKKQGGRYKAFSNFPKDPSLN